MENSCRTIYKYAKCYMKSGAITINAGFKFVRKTFLRKSKKKIA